MDQEKEIIELGRKVAALEQAVDNLAGWQKAQNGSIKEVRQDVGKLKYWIMGAAFGVALNLVGVVFMLLKR
ncbi:MAG: hypothetical protein K6U74_21030 [Firmicutes bacterium]|nr:hypothetical protein [Bacillota bacterium]